MTERKHQAASRDPIDFPTDFSRNADFTKNASVSSVEVVLGNALKQYMLGLGDRLEIFLASNMACLIHFYSGCHEIELALGKTVAQFSFSTQETSVFSFKEIETQFRTRQAALSERCQFAVVSGSQKEALDVSLPCLEIFLQITSSSNDPAVEIGYNRNLFLPSTILRLSRNLASLAVAVTEAALSSVPLHNLPWVSTEELEKLTEWEVGTFGKISPHPVHQLFQLQAASSPDRVAIHFQRAFAPKADKREYTFSQVDEITTKLSSLLKKKFGLDKGEMVGLMVNEGPDMVFAQLAIWKAGAAFVPIDPGYPSQYVEFVVSDAKCKLVIVAAGDAGLKVKSKLEKDLREVVVVLGMDILKQGSEALVFSSLAPESRSTPVSATSHIIYTSGSTGKPKGVVCHHEALVCYILGQVETRRINATSRLFLASAFTFDPSLGDIYSALCFGGTLCMATRENTTTSLLKALHHAKASHVTATPALWGILTQDYIEASRGEGEQGEDTSLLPSLKVVSIGGEAMPSELIQFWAPRLQLINTYGVTEATVYQTTHACRRDSTPSLVGRPMPNVLVRILACSSADIMSSGKLPARVPIGVVGELFLSGPQIAKGYLKRPDLSKSKFLKFSTEAGRAPGTQTDLTWYRTGDLAMWSTNGEIILIGRTDFQIKLSGLRVETGEVEAAVKKADWMVQEAVVVPCAKKESLICYVVLKPEVFSSNQQSGMTTSSQFPPQMTKWKADLLSSALELHCTSGAGVLLNHMIPHVFIPITKMPLTLSGKIDRNALPNRRVFDSFLRTTRANAGRRIQAFEKTVDSQGLDFVCLRDFVLLIWCHILSFSFESLLENKDASEEVDELDFLRMGGSSLSSLRVCKLLRNGLVEHVSERDSGMVGDLGANRKRRKIHVNTEGFWEQFLPTPKRSFTQKEKDLDRLGMLGLDGSKNNPFHPLILSGTNSNLLSYTHHLYASGLRAPTEFVLARSTLQEDIGNGKAKQNTPESSKSVAGEPSDDGDSNEMPMGALNRSDAALMQACMAGFERVVRTLLECGIGPDLTLREGEGGGKTQVFMATGTKRAFTPLHAAAANGHSGIIRLLLSKKCAMTTCTKSLQMATHFACQRSQTVCLLLLLRNGSPLTARDKNKQSLIHAAARSGSVLCLKVLEAAFHFKMLGHCMPEDFVRFLTEDVALRKSDEIDNGEFEEVVNSLDRWGRTALHWAVLNGHREAVKFLVVRGRADPSKRIPTRVQKHRTRLVNESSFELARRIHGDDSDIMKIISEVPRL